jgi:hypothetical protein
MQNASFSTTAFKDSMFNLLKLSPKAEQSVVETGIKGSAREHHNSNSCYM